MVRLGQELLSVASEKPYDNVCIVLERGIGTSESLYDGTVIDCAQD